MTLGKAIRKLRDSANLSQEQFSVLFGVSQQSVQKWETEETTPALSKIILMAKHFGVSLDALVLGNDQRVVDDLKGTQIIKPQYENLHDWEFYASNLTTEFAQSMEEGLDVGAYADVFKAVSRLPKNEIKKRLGDVLFEVVSQAKMREGYPYIEPSDLASIQALCKPHAYEKQGKKDRKSQVTGAWLGRIAGCMLGKTVEGIHTDELVPFLKETGNYPMHRYILRSDLTDEILKKYTYGFAARDYADEIDGMPVDDDTNYTVLYQEVVEKYGRDFTPFDVSRAWLALQGKDAYCTAERVAFCNFVKGYAPPESAKYKNPYREWIGAQIRADYFGYINPGNPALAAEMAWRDACISHIKNGIYGEMWVAAMLAVAAETDNTEDIVLGGMGQIPHTSRLYSSLEKILKDYRAGVSQEECFANIHKAYDEYSAHGWCHTISNAMIVAAALLYGKGDFGKSICMAVETGFDTDCNGATVGSILGMARGAESIPACWTEPLCDTLHTSIFGVDTVRISDRVRMTFRHTV